MADEAVLDAPVLEEVVEQETPEQGVEEVQQETAETAAAPVDDIKGDERTIPAWMRELKLSNPAAFKEAKGLFFGKRSLDDKLKDFDVDATRSFLEEHGGQEGLSQRLTEMAASSQELESINQAIATADPELIKEMAAAHPESFPKLAQAAHEQWLQMDPEGWQRTMSGVFAATITQSGIPAFLDKMEMMLKYGDTASFGESLKELQKWAGSFSQTAAKPVTQTQPAKIDQREQRLNQQEQSLKTERFNRGIEEIRGPLMEKGLKDFVCRAPADTEKRDAAMEMLRTRVDKQVGQDKDLQSKVVAHITAGRIDDALQLIKSRESKIIADLAPKVGRIIYGTAEAPKPKPAPTPIASPNRPATTNKPRDRFAEIFDSL